MIRFKSNVSWAIILICLAGLCFSGCSENCTAPVEQTLVPHFPWPDEDAEILALLASHKVVAPRDLYDIIHHDLEAIRSVWCDSIPQLCTVSPRPGWIVGSMGLRVDQQTFAAIQASTYTAWDSLNYYYGLKEIRLHAAGHPTWQSVTLNFYPRLNPTFLLEAYTQLPGVQSAYKQLLGGGGPDLTASISTDRNYYTFTHAWGDCPAGCIYQHSWNFHVEGGQVFFDGEFGHPDEWILRLRRLPAFGFCAQLDEIFSVDVVRDYQTRYQLSGTILRESDNPAEGCREDIINDAECPVEVPFGPLGLSVEQTNTLDSLLSAIPDEDVLPDPACDPCLVTNLMVRGQTIEVNPCASEHTQQFWDSVAALEEFLDQFVPASEP